MIQLYQRHAGTTGQAENKMKPDTKGQNLDINHAETLEKRKGVRDNGASFGAAVGDQILPEKVSCK